MEPRVLGLTTRAEKLPADSGFVGRVAARGATQLGPPSYDHGVDPPPSAGGGFEERKDGQPCLSWGAQSSTTGRPPPLSDLCALRYHLASWGGPGDREHVSTCVGCGHAGR